MLLFHNPGEIDIRGACIAGLSAKETDSPIGYFGTGLKYAIACILRWNGEITIYSGTSKYKFETGNIDYRGVEFKQIYMNGAPLGFTTEYGKNWKPWQVFRELYANARDEGGTVIQAFLETTPFAGTTNIYVDCKELIESFHNRDKIILPLSTRFAFENEKVQFNEARNDGLYYRGVKVHEQASLYTWNFLSPLQLTEDRTLVSPLHASHLFDSFICEHLHDVDIIMKLFRMELGEDKITLERAVEHEGKVNILKERPIEATFMSWLSIPTSVHSWHSEEFKTALKNLYLHDPATYHKLLSFVKSLDPKLVESKLHVMSEREQRMFDKAKELVALFGFEDEINRLPIYIQELGGGTLGLHENNTIYLSPKLFDQGTKQLVATLYEECYHNRTQNEDCTYSMQSDLFNIIISLNEELHKVIC